jgi:hypothetical protein
MSRDVPRCPPARRGGPLRALVLRDRIPSNDGGLRCSRDVLGRLQHILCVECVSVGIGTSERFGAGRRRECGVGARSRSAGTGWAQVVVFEVGALVPGEAVAAVDRVGWSKAWRASRARNFHRAWTLDPSLGFRARLTRLFRPCCVLTCRRSARATLQPSTDARPVLRARRIGRSHDIPIPLDAWQREARQVAAAMLGRGRVSR